jgi:hypothetical protein
MHCEVLQYEGAMTAQLHCFVCGQALMRLSELAPTSLPSINLWSYVRAMYIMGRG